MPGTRIRRLIAWLLLCWVAATGATPPAELTLVTLNLAHGRGTAFSQLLIGKDRFGENLKTVADTLAPLKPDLVALQEADAASRWSGNFDHVGYLANRLGMDERAHSLHIDNWAVSYGTALLSRLPLAEQIDHVFAGSFPTPNKGFTLARIHWQPDPAQPAQAIDVVSLHLDFSRQSVRLAQMAELIAVVAERDAALIVMGDFNDARLAAELLPAAMAKQDRVLHSHPQAGEMPTYKSNVLDWILISEELAFSGYQVLEAPLSDHRAVVARVRLH
ncbi:endonuclease/exonuclease/phosphatase family protein [Simiduia agarivorans]|uniref:Endonuclease/exonuclease/phosphatase n=1 Tax=Simiduia agarivorans (strain DSM 21679 / JCM 13881 / BCRC 17597 / SA1) TaxID=1117647 RepID=K4KLV7_SIMAS|nr:endonuclease/exonuclease/phosphatase family protein [Simiduia agarivorans]AFU99190.1 endonuclease/exonuclease/phosphatase [Simiduia agarivorans SA1 = DSM 21679]